MVDVTLEQFETQQSCSHDDLRKHIRFVAQLMTIDKYVKMECKQLQILNALSEEKICLQVAQHKLVNSNCL